MTMYVRYNKMIDHQLTYYPCIYKYALVSIGAPAMVSNVMIDIYSIITNNNNVSFTLNWDEPFANFDPIVNYTITINCSDASCPVMLTVTTTSTSVNFITDLSMMTRLSVTASNTAGTSDPATVVIDSKLLYVSKLHTYVPVFVCVNMNIFST